ncbi:MAG: helix-turn-helix transcriptional regulator [Clostridia bacterium]|nr:helix-turn-helix transcriptional regulator [Clostridia bacterium]
MEFGEKLQDLRKKKGLTQEELAEALYVSRTAVSKWESGRGYPSIDSLKEISRFFSVSIDELLSSEKLLSIAEKENKFNMRSMCDMLIGAVDLFYLILIILPLYPNTVDGFVYSVNLLNYTQATYFNRVFCWVGVVSLVVLGVLKIMLTRMSFEKGNKVLTGASMIISIIMVIFLALMRYAYAVVVAFLLLIIKGIILVRKAKNVWIDMALI